jgi:hypothetical protein
MAQFNISSSTTTSMDSSVSNFSVDSKTIDKPFDDQETFYDNTNWTKYLGYYKSIPELKKAIDALAMWTVGKGYRINPYTEVILEHISGWGEDTFESILMNMLIVKKINGDSYAEIIRDDNELLLNIKPLDPADMRIVVNKKGIITRYEQWNRRLGLSIRKFEPEEILHLSNDRISSEIHGISVVEACQWVIDARNEAMSDWRRILHRNLAGLRIIEVEEDDTTKLNTLRTQWATAINKGEVLILPKGTASPVNINPPVNPENWIRYLENFFYQAVGVPKIILGGSQEFTEASSKVGYLTFEQVYISEQRLLEQDLWNQLGIDIEFERPVSLKEAITQSEQKNTGQIGFQQNEMMSNMTRNE